MSRWSSLTGYRLIPSASKGSGASPGEPAHPTQAPESMVRITDSIAVTRPPGLVTHSVAPSGRVRESTGGRLATTTSSCSPGRSWTEDEVGTGSPSRRIDLGGEGANGEPRRGSCRGSRADATRIPSAIGHPRDRRPGLILSELQV